MTFQVYQNTIFGPIISRNGVQTDLRKLNMPPVIPPSNKKDVQPFLGIMKYWGNSHHQMQTCVSH